MATNGTFLSGIFNRNLNFNKFRLTHYQEVTNQYFRYSIKINSNQSKSIKIYPLISKIDGNRSVEFLWLSISAIKQLIISILIEKYRKDKKWAKPSWLIRFSVVFSPSSLARTDKQQLETDIKVNKHIHNTLFALLISTLRICMSLQGTQGYYMRSNR